MGSSFAIAPPPHDNQMFSKEVAQKIRKILEGSGYSITDKEHADYLLQFDFAMTSDTKTINVPHYIPGPSKSVEGNVTGADGVVHYQEETTLSGTTVFVPEDFTFFTRNLLVSVFDAETYRSTGIEEQVWEGYAVSTGSSDDFRDMIDYLLVSAFKYFGKNTHKNVETTLLEDNESIQWLRGNCPF